MRASHNKHVEPVECEHDGEKCPDGYVTARVRKRRMLRHTGEC